MTLPASEIQKLVTSAIVDLFELDMTALGGVVTYFHAGTNQLKLPVVWQGNTYSPFPVEATGFEMTGKGTQPQPRIRVANVLGIIAALCREMDDIVGAKLTRHRTFAKHLDAVNFPGGINPTADPTIAFPDEVWFVNRKSEENELFVDFELSSASDVSGVLIPRRQCIANICMWRYRSAECSYAGPPVADINDQPTSDPALDQCGKRRISCKFRFGEFGQLPYGGFPATGLVR